MSLERDIIEDDSTQESKFSVEEEHGVNLLSELFKEVFEILSQRRNQFVARQNFLVFKHGKNWSGYTKTEDSSAKHWKGSFEKKSAQGQISWDSILDADFSAIERFKDEFTEELVASFESSFFGAIAEATENQTPVELKINGDIRPGLLQMWEGISLGLNDDLTLSEPSMALDAETFDKFMAKAQDLMNTDPGFFEQIDQIKRRKWISALIEHFENLLKYKLNDDERRNLEHQLRQLRSIAVAELHKIGRDDDSGEPT